MGVLLNVKVKISEVSKEFNVSTRMLRYYEKMGIIKSQRKEGYAYRVYDENAVRRLQYIIILRKLRIPIKQIGEIFKVPLSRAVMQIINKNISEIDDEITALDTIRSALKLLAAKFKETTGTTIRLNLLKDDDIIEVIEHLPLSKVNVKGGQPMEELNKANNVLEKLQKVRIVLLPPCTVASYHFEGENPEDKVGNTLDKFVRESNLYEKKPDSRMFGFNHPNPSPDRPYYGYEAWVTIPDDMEVPAPLVKKKFEGGMYAAHTIKFPEFQEWGLLTEWVDKSDKYDADYSDLGEEIMGGCLEEHLNWVYSSYKGWPENGIDGYLDLLFPVKLK